jgi:predicted nuclease of predicted toxin-antitoxin system
VKLLFDENLSPKLPRMLASEYPGSVNVREAGLRGAADSDLWDYARAHGFAIVSKDTDFRERSFVEGSPPKIIWLDVGNARTTVIADLLRKQRPRAEEFAKQEESSFLILSVRSDAV